MSAVARSPAPLAPVVPLRLTHDLLCTEYSEIVDVQVAGSLLIMFLRTGKDLPMAERVYSFHTVTGIYRQLSTVGLSRYRLHDVFLTGLDRNGVTAMCDLRPLFGEVADVRSRVRFIYYPELTDLVQRVVAVDDALLVLTVDGNVFCRGRTPFFSYAMHGATVERLGVAQHTVAQRYIDQMVEQLLDGAPVETPDVDASPLDLVQLPCLTRVADIAVMGSCVLMCLRDHSGLVALGLHGPLSDDTYNALQPLLTIPDRITQIAASEQHVLLSGKHTYGFGSNLNGELGEQNAEEVVAPCIIDTAPTFQLFAREGSSTIVTEDGILKTTKRTRHGGSGSGYRFMTAHLRNNSESDATDSGRPRVAQFSASSGTAMVAIATDRSVYMKGAVGPGRLYHGWERMASMPIGW